MGGSPEDWRPVQTRQPGLSLAVTPGASPAESAAALADEVASMVGGSFALCGYSMGGRIAILAAKELLARKKKPDALILVSAGFGFPTDEEREERNRHDLDWAALAESDAEGFWKKWYEQELFASFQALTEANRAAWLEHRKAMDIADLTSQLRFLGPGRHEHLLPTVKDLAGKGVRVLYIAGELDKKYSELSRSAGEIPGVLVDTVPHAGHVLPLEAPEALALRITRFIR
jgi:2-succinyl-6-hydroxy-2,4-cyclohexadiene-1-carboxylate synthase